MYKKVFLFLGLFLISPLHSSENPDCPSRAWVQKYFGTKLTSKSEDGCESNQVDRWTSDQIHGAYAHYQTIMKQIKKGEQPRFFKSLEELKQNFKNRLFGPHYQYHLSTYKDSRSANAYAYLMIQNLNPDTEWILEAQYKVSTMLEKESLQRQIQEAQEKSKTTPAVKKTKRLHRDLKWV